MEKKQDNKKQRFELRQLWRKGWWRCVDNEHGISLDWQVHHFNDIQEARMTKEARESVKGEHPELIIAGWLREMTDWLRTHHADKML